MLTILVDLDGTIIDPASGIVASYRHAFERLGMAPLPPDSVHTLIGPPLRRAFGDLLGPERDIEEAVRLYREHYGTAGMFDAVVYPGMATVLAALRALPARLFVCTAKAAYFATPIVAHFGLAHLFDAVHGPDLAGRHDDKSELIGHMLEAEGIDARMAVMIGDRANDVLAAARHGIPTVGALWGYGDEAELTSAGAATLCQSPAELVDSVRALRERKGRIASSE